MFNNNNNRFQLQVMFLCVEAEEIPEISLKYEVEAVPTFIFIKNKQKIGRLDGASAPDLTKMVKVLIHFPLFTKMIS